MSEESKDLRIIIDKPRSKKLKPKIDMTAMVSISFLLIIFFMVTKELSKPQAINLGLPDNDPVCGGHGGCGFRNERIITLLLDDDNKVISYNGFLISDENDNLINYNPLLDYKEDKPRKLGYGKEIRTELIEMQSSIIEKTGDRNRGAIVIIKPCRESNFKNLVDILDEMAITEIPTYVIVNDFSPNEMKLLASK